MSAGWRKILIVGLILSGLTGCATTNSISAPSENAVEKTLRDIITDLSAGQLSAAYAQLRTLPELDQPLFHQAWAYYYELTEQVALADQAYRAAMFGPNKVAVENNYASFLCRQGHYHEAMQHYQQALSQSDVGPLQRVINHNAGECALEFGDETVASSYFKQAQQASPHVGRASDNMPNDLK